LASLLQRRRLKLNSITLSGLEGLDAGSKQVRSWSQTGSKQVRTCLRPSSNQLRTNFEPDSVMEFGLYWRPTKPCTMFDHLLGWYTIYIFWGGGSCPRRNFVRCKIDFASKSCVLLYWQRYCTALEQRASAKVCGVQLGGHHVEQRPTF